MVIMPYSSSLTFQPVLERIATEIAQTPGRGRPADYIPALAARDPRSFGMAVAELDGTVYGVGDWQQPFSTQSITKVFTLALDLAREGDELWEHVGREPSGNPFNSLVQLEYENGIPRNPFINAGALVVTDRLQTQTGDAAGALLDFLRAESGNPRLTFDKDVAASEAAHGDRNAALGHFMASYGNIDNPVPPSSTSTSASARSRRPAPTSPSPPASWPGTASAPTAPGCSPAARPNRSTRSCSPAAPTTRRATSPTGSACPARAASAAASSRWYRAAARCASGARAWTSGATRWRAWRHWTASRH